MNRRQVLKTLALLPVTPVEKLLEPAKAPACYLMGCSEITLFATKERPAGMVLIQTKPHPGHLLDDFEATCRRVQDALLADMERRAAEHFYFPEGEPPLTRHKPPG